MEAAKQAEIDGPADCFSLRLRPVPYFFMSEGVDWNLLKDGINKGKE
jgi:hypothetical protein